MTEGQRGRGTGGMASPPPPPPPPRWLPLDVDNLNRFDASSMASSSHRSSSSPAAPAAAPALREGAKSVEENSTDSNDDNGSGIIGEALLPVASCMLPVTVLNSASSSEKKMYPKSRCNLSNRALDTASATKAVALYEDAERIDLSRNHVASLPFLSLCGDRLTWLSLARNELGTLEGLWAVPLLQHLDVSHNMLRSTMGVGNCTKLRSFNASHNSVEIIEGMEALRSLKHLDVSCNNLARRRSLRSLSCNSGLQELNLEGNPVDDASGTLRHFLMDLCPSVCFFNGAKMSPSPSTFARRVRKSCKNSYSSMHLNSARCASKAKPKDAAAQLAELSLISPSSASPRGHSREAMRLERSFEDSRLGSFPDASKAYFDSMMADDEPEPEPEPQETNAETRTRMQKTHLARQLRQHGKRRKTFVRKGLYPSGDLAASWAASLRGGSGARPITTPRGLTHMARSDAYQVEKIRKQLPGYVRAEYDAAIAAHSSRLDDDDVSGNDPSKDGETGVDLAMRRFGRSRDAAAHLPGSVVPNEDDDRDHARGSEYDSICYDDAEASSVLEYDIFEMRNASTGSRPRPKPKRATLAAEPEKVIAEVEPEAWTSLPPEAPEDAALRELQSLIDAKRGALCALTSALPQLRVAAGQD